jgi:ABC-type microcin C transport system permease subunit YejB
MVGVVLKKSGRNYPQHLYFALHVHAAWFAAAAVSALAKLTLPVSIAVAVSITAVIYSMVYFVRALMVAYDLGGRQATLRGAVVMSMYSVALIVVTMAIVIPVIFGPTGLKQILNQ